MTRSTAKNLQIAGVVIGVIGLVTIIIALIITFAGAGGGGASTALWIIGGILTAVGIALYSIGAGGLRVGIGST